MEPAGRTLGVMMKVCRSTKDIERAEWLMNDVAPYFGMGEAPWLLHDLMSFVFFC